MTARFSLSHREREGAKRQGEGSNDETFSAYCPHPAFGHPLPGGEGSHRKYNGQTPLISKRTGAHFLGRALSRFAEALQLRTRLNKDAAFSGTRSHVTARAWR